MTHWQLRARPSDSKVILLLSSGTGALVLSTIALADKLGTAA